MSSKRARIPSVVVHANARLATVLVPKVIANSAFLFIRPGEKNLWTAIAAENQHRRRGFRIQMTRGEIKHMCGQVTAYYNVNVRRSDLESVKKLAPFKRFARECEINLKFMECMSWER